MSDLPNFFDKFKEPEVEPPQPVLDQTYAINLDKPSSVRTSTFTVRDWEFVAHIAIMGSYSTNGELAKHFGIGRAAASSRIKRLVEMGLLSVSYEHADETGNVNRRTIVVNELPERPWSPE